MKVNDILRKGEVALRILVITEKQGLTDFEKVS